MSEDLVNIKEAESWETLMERQDFHAPLVDIFENDNEYFIIANMPGVSRDDIRLKIEDDSLLIFGRVNYEEAVNRKYILNENEIGNYFRKFRVSDNIDETKIEAKYENGQLIVKLPKHERVKPRTISIK